MTRKNTPAAIKKSKKTATDATSTAPAVPPSRFTPREVDGFKCFSRADMLELQLGESRLEAAKHSAAAKLAEAQDFQRAASKRLEELTREVEEARKLAAKRGEELAALHAEIGEAYGIDLRRVAFDDVTGRITAL